MSALPIPARARRARLCLAALAALTLIRRPRAAD